MRSDNVKRHMRKHGNVQEHEQVGDFKSHVSSTVTLEELIKRKTQSADRHKSVECKVCLCKMKSNNLKRHIQKHRHYYYYY